MNTKKYMTLKSWKEREFAGKPLDNRTIKKYIADGKLVGILDERATFIREDQTLANLSTNSKELDELLRLSA